MENRNILFVAVAVIIGLVAVFLANSYFTGVEQRQQLVADEQQLARIVVATQDLEFGTPLSTENLRLQNFPANSVPEGAFRSIEDALRGGRVALRPIVVNEPVLASKVSGSGGRAVLSANLAEGMRAIAIPVSEVRGVSGFVRPGDVVDIFLTRQIMGEGATEQDLVTEVLMENVKVLAIDQVASEDSTEPQVGRTAVMEVDQNSAQRLVLAERLGSLSLALRNVDEQDQLVGNALVTSRMLASSRLIIPARPQRAAPAANVQMANLTGGNLQGLAPPARTAPVGPTMTIYRGVEVSEVPVSRMGGR